MLILDAFTLKDLKAAIELVIEKHGETAEWNGFNDGYIYIQDDQGSTCIRNEVK